MTKETENPPARKELLSPEELAAHLGCGRTYVYQLLAEGVIPSFKIGRLRRIRRSDVDIFVGRQIKEAARE